MSSGNAPRLAGLLGAGIFPLSQVAAGAEPCAIRAIIEPIIRTPLPAFIVAAESDGKPDSCSKTVAGDFNGDGRTDYAAVLTEATAPQTRSYIVVFLATALPYSEYQAITLLGHSSAPRRMNLETATAIDDTRRTMLIVKNASYSRTVYEWTATGFHLSQHDAD
jgi:hypothetical protein